jgi:predicted metal-binding protein
MKAKPLSQYQSECDSDQSFEIHVCVGCSPKNLTDKEQDQTESATISDLIRAESDRRSLSHAPHILEFRCLSGCKLKGRVSINSKGRWSILFAGILSPADVRSLFTFIELWLNHPQGETTKLERPAGLRSKIIGRVPPL